MGSVENRISSLCCPSSKAGDKGFALMIPPTCVEWILLCARLNAGH